MSTLVIIVLTLIVLGLGVGVFVLATQISDANRRLKSYEKITDIEKHVEEQRSVAAKTKSEAQDLKQKIDKAKQQYSQYVDVLGKFRSVHELQARVDTLASEVKKAESQLVVAQGAAEMESIGLYERVYDYDDPAYFRRDMDECIKKQKAMVKEGEACVAQQTWVVGDSVKKGEQMMKEQINLMLRAFNGDCTAAIAKVKHGNFATQEKKIRRAFDALNKLGKTKEIFLQPEYLTLKIQELRLTNELEIAKKAQKDREREIREQMREEAKAEKEIADARKKAERDEELKLKALDKARKELSDEHGKHNEKLAGLVAKLEGELAEALDRKAKAIARAQLTRSGHVYVLSNVGTMGERVYKIGMTRRLVPDDRVKELGDASVPFPFDVHAMIYSEDAPALEKSLHNHFDERRVNQVNRRKEYFNVTLQELQEAVKQCHTGAVTFVVDHPAEEYRESILIREKIEHGERQLHEEAEEVEELEAIA